MSEWKETDIGRLPINWTIVSVAELLVDKGISVGVMYPGEDMIDDGIPMIRVGDIKGGKIAPNGVYRISESVNDLHKRTILQGGELLVTLVGNPGASLVVTEEYKGWNVARAIGVLKLRSPSDGKYLSYSLSSPFSRFLIESYLNTTVQPTLNLGELKMVLVPWPDEPTRSKISEVLSSLDDKIDLLHRQNDTLEKMAETIFRQWFVEEEKDDWEEATLEEHVHVVSGYSYRSDDLNPSTTALVTLKNFERTGGFRIDGFKEYTGKYKQDQIVTEGDLIVAHTDITQEAEVLGNPAIVIGTPKYTTLVISTDLVKVVPKSYFSKCFLYYLMKSDDFKHYCLGCSNGTTVLHLSKKAIPSYEFKVPPRVKIEEFTKTVTPILMKTQMNFNQLITLEQTRDTLLPKLMSGLVRVN